MAARRSGRDVLDILVQSRRNKRAAKKFFRKLLKGLRYVPRAIITDKLRSYAAAKGRSNAFGGAPTARQVEYSGGEFPSTHPGKGTADAWLQVARARPAIPLDFRSDRIFFRSWTASTGGPELPRDPASPVHTMACSHGSTAGHLTWSPGFHRPRSEAVVLCRQSRRQVDKTQPLRGPRRPAQVYCAAVDFTF